MMPDASTPRVLGWEDEALLGDIEFDYACGNSFSVGDDDVLRWMLQNGWHILRPVDYPGRVWRDEWDDGGDGSERE